MSLESEVQKLTVASNEQTAASQALAQEVAGKMKEITDASNAAIGRVDAAIPTAVDDELSQALYLDTVGGDDATATGDINNPFKTLKALVDSVPVGACINVRGNSDQVIDIDADIRLMNKHLSFWLNGPTVEFNAKILMTFSSIKFAYPGTYNQHVAVAFRPSNSVISLFGGTVAPRSGSECFIKPTYTGSDVTEPGGLYNQVDIPSLTVLDADSSYDLIKPTHYQSIMAVVARNLTLGANVSLFNSLYEPIQFGTKGSYMIGA